MDTTIYLIARRLIDSYRNVLVTLDPDFGWYHTADAAKAKVDELNAEVEEAYNRYRDEVARKNGEAAAAYAEEVENACILRQHGRTVESPVRYREKLPDTFMRWLYNNDIEQFEVVPVDEAAL